MFDDMKKEKKITVWISTNGKNVQIEAYCLTTDSWEDYQGLKQDAHEAFERQDLRRANRYVRAALLLLFSHLEGVIKNICDHINAPRKIKAGSLKKRIGYVELEAKRHRHIPELNNLGKNLRDIVAHPGIEKVSSDGEKIDEIYIYKRLNPQSLSDIGGIVDQWLTAVCCALNVERFSDTRGLVEMLGKKIGATVNSGEI